MALLSPRFPPAALSLSQLGEGEDITDAECACLVQCLWGLAREMVPGGLADTRVLESSRTFLSWLVSRASASRADTQKERSRELAMKQLGSAAVTAAPKEEVAPAVRWSLFFGGGDLCFCAWSCTPSHAFAEHDFFPSNRLRPAASESL